MDTDIWGTGPWNARRVGKEPCPLTELVDQAPSVHMFKVPPRVSPLEVSIQVAFQWPGPASASQSAMAARAGASVKWPMTHLKVTLPAAEIHLHWQHLMSEPSCACSTVSAKMEPQGACPA